jgi:iron complex transport system substrate-binding protein
MSFVSGFRSAVFAAMLPAALAMSPGEASAGEVEGVLSDATRIASVGGSITEIVYALGEEKRLVARDSTSVYPEAAFSIPDIGYMRQLSPEGVLSVNPTAILALEGSGPKEAIDVLKTAELEYIEIPERFDRQGVLDKIRLVGTAIGADAKAEKLAASVAADIDAAAALSAGVQERKRVLFVLSLQGGRVLASGSGTAANGMIALAGGVNAVEGFQGYKPLSNEAILAADPDVVLMMDRGGSDESTREAELFSNPAIAASAAGQAHALVHMDGAYLLGFGPRTAAAVRDLSEALYGAGASD